jgi:ribonucleoside-diphosphate reductase alpha chain
MNNNGTTLSDNALSILKQRYFMEGEDWYGLCNRVTNTVMAELPEAERKTYFDMIHNLQFVPNTPTLVNAGKAGQSLPACFVIPIEDSMEGIFDCIKTCALVAKSGGGCGIDFSPLREAGAKVKSTNGQSSGVISFMEVFNSATDSIKQGGVRRGAMMSTLRIDHPEIINFIEAKDDTTKLTNFNMSVMITDKFMLYVENKAKWQLISPVNGVVDEVDAVELFNKIVHQAWKTGEPGLVFIDEINRYNPTPDKPITGVNACSEQPLLPHESCVLGSINVDKFIVRDGNGLWKLHPNVEDTVRQAVRLLDNIIDVNNYVLPEIEEATKATRKIGLGVMGLADFYYRAGVEYGSQESIEIAEHIMYNITDFALYYSAMLAKEKGTYPEYSEESALRAFGKFMSERTKEAVKKYGLRNANVTTVAPTGSISIIADCSSGIEPNFALSYKRRTDTGIEWVTTHKYIEDVLNEYVDNVNYRESILEEIIDGTPLHGIHPIREYPEVKRILVTSHDIKPSAHLDIQSAIQKHTTAGISKTINMPNSAKESDVAEIYRTAWLRDCKGVTVYRDGSRSNQVLSLISKDKETAEQSETTHHPRKRPVTTKGQTTKIGTACGSLYVTVNSDDNGVCEVFAQMGKGGNCASAQLEAMARLISLCLRGGIDVKDIVKQMSGIKCTNTIWHNGDKICSCADAIANVISEGVLLDKETDVGIMCPDCGENTVVLQEGCSKCSSCGWSKC